MTENEELWVFFYGSFIDGDVLSQYGVYPESIEVARVDGFDIIVAPLANLIPSERDSVYGTLTRIRQAELEKLYGQEWVSAYYPVAVLAETKNGRKVPALCYVSKEIEGSQPDQEYLSIIVESAKNHKFPGWYIERLLKYSQT